MREYKLTYNSGTTKEIPFVELIQYLDPSTSKKAQSKKILKPTFMGAVDYCHLWIIRNREEVINMPEGVFKIHEIINEHHRELVYSITKDKAIKQILN